MEEQNTTPTTTTTTTTPTTTTNTTPTTTVVKRGTTSMESKVKVRFVTQNEAIRVTDAPIAIPIRLGRFGLSEVINHLLDKSPPRPFDFLIADEFVRTSLEKHIKKYNISEDLLITIEYEEAIEPPEHELACLHDDWIACIAGGFSGYVVSGSYDKKVRIWDQSSGACVSTVEGHEGAVKSVAWVSKGKSGAFKFVTGSTDRTVRFWKVSKETGEQRLVHFYTGHEESVDAVDVNLEGTMICSSSYDSTIRVWPTKPSDSELSNQGESGVKKKRKLSKPLVEITEAKKILLGHTGAVTCVRWPTHRQIISGGFDKTIRIWDVESGLPEILNVPTVVFCVSHTTIAGLIATSHADKIVRIWDPRVPDGKAIQFSFASHGAWASGVAWHPKTQHPQFASCSHDGTVKVWDLRSPTPLFTLPSHSDRVLCVDWAGVHVNEPPNSKDGGGKTDTPTPRFDVVSGGADNKLSIWKYDL